MTWPKWVLLAMYAFSFYSTIDGIGKPRKPLTAEMAVAVLTMIALWSVLVVIA